MVAPPSSPAPGPVPGRTAASRSARVQALVSAAVRGFHTYANWLVGISWKRFFGLSLLLIVATALLGDIPPFNYKWTEYHSPDSPKPPPKPAASRASEAARYRYEIRIEPGSVRIGPMASEPLPGAAASMPLPPNAPTAPTAPTAPPPPAPLGSDGKPLVLPEVTLPLPEGADAESIRDAIESARESITDALSDLEDAESPTAGHSKVVIRVGDWLMNLALLFIITSAIVKITYKGRLQAEVKAAQATETAESESLRRQVVEARMAAMQAQVEPHFLFNTLASIDHLIEVDPARASVMQKHLIALLRASMPTMREANAAGQGSAHLGRELSVVRPYLEILQLRMEERLQVSIDVPEGLLSAEIPPMMIQSLVENAVKHGLEPKPEGGQLLVKAEIVHGRLLVTVADTGLGFGRSHTSGTGVGLANIRERLALLYGGEATLAITENQPSGTRVTITVPYRIHHDNVAAAATRGA